MGSVSTVYIWLNNDSEQNKTEQKMLFISSLEYVIIIKNKVYSSLLET